MNQVTVPKQYEETFAIWPTGVRYRCEFCEDGEMKVVGKVHNNDLGGREMYLHHCDKCNREIQLPKAYPYIDWTPLDRSKVDPDGLKFFTDALMKKLDERYQPLTKNEE